ncbi:C40 family peptidase [Sphingomonas sp. FW199]|uniref:C40 family peptidase n=1 Tax=Sphingomonas sp. FW199 TaxID=3400217 RepID=UPI003CFA8254
MTKSDNCSVQRTPNGTVDAAPQVERFHLDGKSRAYDPRVTPARRDLVDVRLAGSIFAPHYSRALTAVASADLPLWPTAQMDGDPLSIVLDGEPFEVLEVAADRAWGRAADGSVGYVAASGLDADIPQRALPARLPGTPAERARHLVGTPYQAGGRSVAGVDTAGFIFLVLGGSAGKPRFRPMQDEAGSAVDRSAVQPGDLLFATNGVAVLVDDQSVVTVDSASGVIELPLAEWLAQVGEVSARRVRA